MKKILVVLCVLALFAALVSSAAAAPAHPLKMPKLMQTTPVTMYIPDPELIIVVQSGSQYITFYSRPEGVTKSVPVADHYTFWAANCQQENILVLDAGKKLVARSYWPGAPLTIGRADNVPPSAQYWVLKQVLPSAPTSLGEIAPTPAGSMTLMIPDPELLVVVQAGDKFVTYYSRPEGVTKEIGAGPYVFWASNGGPKNILVFDKDLVLVASSFWPGEPVTRFRTEGVPTGSLYWVIEESIPSNVPMP